MAPAYALLISLSVALVLGMAMRPPDASDGPSRKQPPSADAISIHLVTTGKDEHQRPVSIPARKLVGSAVTIQSSEPLSVGEDGTFDASLADGSVTVCVELPENWTAVQPLPGRKPQSPCWNVETKNSSVELVVKEG
jgi:hypothetical protein